MIKKVLIRNYRMFRSLDLQLNPGVNILVGKNDTGKSTLLEAINLALTGRLHGRLLAQELSPYHVNLPSTREYAEKVRAGEVATPPPLVVELYFQDSEALESLRGTNNILGEDACGVRIQATLSTEFTDEYRNFLQKPETIRLAPTEYYRVDWLGFSGNPISLRSLPSSASLIDSTTIRLQPGIDYHLQEIIRTQLDARERVELSRQYRSMRENFGENEAVRAINSRLQAEGVELTERRLTLGIDISQRYTWENNLIAHLDDLPLHMIGKGDQNAIKTLMAIGRRAEDAAVVLIEEPETHLAHTSLRRLLYRIEERCGGKQVIIATHSAFVLNKLGLDNLILLDNGGATRIPELPPATVAYFKKLPGFDTLRLILCDGAILVEGPSDELVVQRAYKDRHAKLPIEDGIDVISVGLSHKRFLDLAVPIRRRVRIVTDNDGKSLDVITARFSEYLTNAFVTLHTGADPEVRTLEPQLAEANDLATLNVVLGTNLPNKESVLSLMLADKTAAALAIFESPTAINMPQYIKDAIA